ncbi:hypothetical protein M9458_058156, partial [Cirrhinus mrigala]
MCNNWRVESTRQATPPYIRVYKMAACIHSFRFLLQSLCLVLSALQRKEKCLPARMCTRPRL